MAGTAPAQGMPTPGEVMDALRIARHLLAVGIIDAAAPILADLAAE